MSKVYLASIGTHLGSEEIPFADIASRILDKNDPNYLRRLRKTKTHIGVNRIFRFKDESLEDALESSARVSMNDSKIQLNDISNVYVSTASTTAEYQMPDPAIVLADRLGIKGNAIPIGNGCVGGFDALLSAYDHLKSKIDNDFTLVSIGDKTSMSLDPEDHMTAYLFSEGAVSLILTNDPKDNSYEIKDIGVTRGKGDIYCMKIKNDKDRKFFMDGKEIHEFVKFQVPDLTMSLLGIDRFNENMFVIPHQASRVILEPLEKQLIDRGLSVGNFYYNGIDNFGNLEGASTMIGLYDILKNDPDKIKGKDIVLLGFGAGLKVGVMHLIPQKSLI